MNDATIENQKKSPLPVWFLLALASFVLGRVGLLLFAYRSFIDDTYIFMRYADNFATSKGLVYNTGEPVMGFTSPLYTIVLGCIRFVTQTLPFEYIVLALSMITLVALTIAIYRLAEAKHRFPALFTIFWLTYFSYVDASINGMETLLFCLLIFGGVRALIAQNNNLAAMLAAAAVLTRPEGALLAVAMLGYVVWTQRLKSAWKGAAFGLLSIAGWFWLAHSVYGAFLPQSMLAKSAAATEGVGLDRPSPITILASLSFGVADDQITNLPRIGTLVFYVGAFLLSGLILWYGWNLVKKKDPSVVLIAFFFLAWAFYVGGKVIHLWSWYTIPTSLCFMFGATSAVGELIEKLRKPKLHIVFAACAGILCVASLGIGLTKRLQRFEVLTRDHASAVKFILAEFPNAKSIALGDIGIVGYESKRRIVDIAMLVTPSAAKTESDGRLISVAKVAEIEEPDIILLTGDIYKNDYIIVASIKRPSFNNPTERAWFEENYVRIPHENGYHKAVYARKAILAGATHPEKWLD